MRYKSLITGKFVSEYYAKRHPKTTVPVENPGKKEAPVAVEWYEVDTLPVGWGWPTMPESEGYDVYVGRVSDHSS